MHLANLGHANLSQADLRRADLSQANLDGANLFGTKYNDTTKWPAKFTPPCNARKVVGTEIKIHIENIPSDVTEEDIRQLFEPYGEILITFLVIEPQKNKLHGFVEMHEQEGNEAIQNLIWLSF